MKPALYSILPRPPHPFRDGLAIRNYHLLRALAEDFRVRAFSLLDPARAYGRGQAPPGVEIEWVPQSPRGLRRAAAAAASLLTGRSYPECLYRSPALARRIAARVSQESPRWIVAHSYHVAPAALSAGPAVWIDFHNLDSEIWERVGATVSCPAAAFARLQAPRVRGLERSLVSKAAGLSCVSSRDAEALRALGAASDPVVVSNGVDLSRYSFRADAAREELVFFVGDLSWPPNAEGIRWFAREIWPVVRRLRPSARAEVLGREPPADLRRFEAADFALLGEGDDTRPLWARAAVAVVPLLSGGGTRLKILEAAACGVPVVSTPLGAEGLAFRAGSEILLHEAPAGFAAAVADLLTDPERARRQAFAARQRVESVYGWSRIGGEFARKLASRGERP